MTDQTDNTLIVNGVPHSFAKLPRSQAAADSTHLHRSQFAIKISLSIERKYAMNEKQLAEESQSLFILQLGEDIPEIAVTAESPEDAVRKTTTWLATIATASLAPEQFRQIPDEPVPPAGLHEPLRVIDAALDTVRAQGTLIDALRGEDDT